MAGGNNKREEAEEEAEASNESMCFPARPCKIMPCLENFLPATWVKIQDSTHFMLALGLFGCICLVVQSVFAIYIWVTGSLLSPGVADGRAVLCVLFAFPLSMYCSRVISQYDERLQSKQKKVKEEKAKLLDLYKGLLSDMDGLLSKSTESASGLAERSFESKRRDFQRFLDRAKNRFNTTGIESEEILVQFRRFCLNWLSVFKECSIDPAERPKLVITEEELMSYTTINEIATVVSERLQTTEVRFITEQRKNDTNNINARRQDLKDFSRGGGARRVLAISNEAAEPGVGSFMGSQASCPSFQERRASLDSLTSTKQRQMTWLTCGKTGCDCKQSPVLGQDCPRTFNCLFVQVKVLSRQHANLLGSLLLGVLSLVLSVVVFVEAKQDSPEQSQEMTAIVFLAITLLSLLVVLLKFEQIDIVQQLEREVEELQSQNKQVQDQQVVMRDFWNKAQQLTELWLYRTVPRLDLYKELHSQLEDTTDDDDLLAHMKGANEALENIEHRLGSLENWRGDGLLKIEDKKNFAKVINELCQEGDPETVQEKMQEVIRGREMANLKAIGF